ncbi:MAG: inorganic phosphate transporter, partial [Planctomycetota bacterium]
MIVALLLVGTLLLAWSNGANDNFKGVATLYGSGVLGYRKALAWASLATLTGGLVSVMLADTLARTFSGEAVLHGGALGAGMLAAMVVAAGVTVLLATFLHMPTSTTHALMGALVGVALASDPSRIRVDRLATLFFAPMLLAPLIALVAVGALFQAWRLLRRDRGAGDDPCACLDPAPVAALATPRGTLTYAVAPALPALRLDAASRCEADGAGTLARVDARGAAGAMHVLSGGAVCFARALNDTPKIAAVLLAASAFADRPRSALLLVVIAFVVVGGLVQSRGVARTMSRRITTLGAGTGLTANLVTAGLVLGASRFGLPVSTTHVSCASLFGVGAAT